jgi:Spy/CpxP family protein refolding chaperone
MRRVTAVIGAAAVVLWAAGVYAQAKPSFAGMWTPDAEKNAAMAPAGGGGGGGRGGGRGGGGPMTITQDATSMTIARETQNGPVETKYMLNGSEQTVQMGQAEAKVKASVKGATIVIETTTDRGNGPTTTTAVYSMEGGELVIATTRPGRGGGDPTTNKVYYKKG